MISKKTMRGLNMKEIIYVLKNWIDDLGPFLFALLGVGIWYVLRFFDVLR